MIKNCRLQECIKGIIITAFLSYFFYRSIWAVPFMGCIAVLFLKIDRANREERLKRECNLEFKECILSVASSLKTGYSVENAFLESSRDMEILYGKHSYIYKELERIRRGLAVNITLEELLREMADRSHSEEILQFSQVFGIAKRNGGNLAEIMYYTVDSISQRIDAKGEIQTMLSGRKMERQIMQLVPFGMVLYIGWASPGYFDGLYHNPQGVAVMTVCLLLYVTAYYLGYRILDRISQEIE